MLVSCIAYFGHRILMCRRAKEPYRGLWTVPAGFMEQKETIEQAAARETAEETGAIIDPSRLELYAVLSLPHLSEVYITLRVELPGPPTLVCGPESSEVALRGEHEIPRENWAFSSGLVEDSAAALFQEIRSGSFGIHKMCMDASNANSYQIRTYCIAAGRQRV
jgi:ADP-ribose pyrophosphatase YjhB (NUDIX family)